MEILENNIKEYYGNIAKTGSSCCAPDRCSTKEDSVSSEVFSLGCGIGGAEDALSGETVLDIGSGTGYDVFRAAEKVGSDGFVYGVDMTEAMIDKASSNANKMGIKNVSFKIGTAESLPIENNSVDLAISNCVINLTPEKSVVFREIHRVLKPGGRIVIQDVVSLNELPDSVKNNSKLWNSCIGGAIPKETYIKMIKDAGFQQVEIAESVSLNIEDYKLLSVRIKASKSDA